MASHLNGELQHQFFVCDVCLCARPTLSYSVIQLLDRLKQMQLSLTKGFLPLLFMCVTLAFRPFLYVALPARP